MKHELVFFVVNCFFGKPPNRFLIFTEAFCSSLEMRELMMGSLRAPKELRTLQKVIS